MEKWIQISWVFPAKHMVSQIMQEDHLVLLHGRMPNLHFPQKEIHFL